MRNHDGHARASEIVKAARRYLGVRFRMQGRTVEGLDCVGLIAAAARDVGVFTPLPAWLPYRGLKPEAVDTLILAAGCRVVALQARRPGDMLLRWPAARQVHLALCTEWGVIEANASIRKVVERGVAPDEVWHAAWRLPEGES